jgi:hypothetical protein
VKKAPDPDQDLQHCNLKYNTFDSASPHRNRDSSPLSAGRSFLLLLVITVLSRIRIRSGVDLLDKYSVFTEDELHSIDYRCSLSFSMIRGQRIHQVIIVLVQ